MTNRLIIDVPVVWLTDLRQPGLPADMLRAGTNLDTIPVAISSDLQTSSYTATVRVDGRMGFVSAARLKEALPDWKPVPAPLDG